jgi:ribosomal protein L3 glutamine methyltransferase
MGARAIRQSAAKSTATPAQPATLGGWVREAEKTYARASVALGQIAGTAHDEALYLFLHALGWPLDSDATVLDRQLTADQRRALAAILQRRTANHIPPAYLTREAWLGGERFYVDERVLIPRSYFVEIIPVLEALLPAEMTVRQAADVCTGSGCLAILLARHFPIAQIDAFDLSPAALEVAAINVRAHRLSRRIDLHCGDVFGAVPPVPYDLILSNPPYEPSARCDRLPTEFQREPRLALDGGPDGLSIIRSLLRQARSRLAPHGLLLIEVGGLRRAMDREFKALRPRWLPTADGSDCICLIESAMLQESGISGQKSVGRR